MLRLLRERLEARVAAGRPVTVALAGAGRFGTSIAAQISQIEGLRLAAVADPNARNAAEALQAAGWVDGQWQRCESPAKTRAALAEGAAVLAPDAEVLGSGPIEVFVDATGIPEIAARNAWAALRQGRHVVMVTVEADVSCGWVLAREARRQGVVYTLAAGDQPVAIMELFDWAKALGLQVVAVGRGTRRYPADRHGDPELALSRLGYDVEAAERLRLNEQMYNSFRDGTKAQIEMCAVSNMTGLPPDRRGMHEPSAGLNELPNLFAPGEAGGLLARAGVVDLANAVGPDGVTEVAEHIADGVWAVVTSDDRHVGEDMRIHGTRVSRDEQRMVLFREYHLCGVGNAAVHRAGGAAWGVVGPAPRGADFGGAGLRQARPAAGRHAGRLRRPPGVRADRPGRDVAGRGRAAAGAGLRGQGQRSGGGGSADSGGVGEGEGGVVRRAVARRAWRQSLVIGEE